MTRWSHSWSCVMHVFRGMQTPRFLRRVCFPGCWQTCSAGASGVVMVSDVTPLVTSNTVVLDSGWLLVASWAAGLRDACFRGMHTPRFFLRPIAVTFGKSENKNIKFDLDQNQKQSMSFRAFFLISSRVAWSVSCKEKKTLHILMT